MTESVRDLGKTAKINPPVEIYPFLGFGVQGAVYLGEGGQYLGKPGRLLPQETQTVYKFINVKKKHAKKQVLCSFLSRNQVVSNIFPLVTPNVLKKK